jgi:citronellol/citronellal dehydrogenase
MLKNKTVFITGASRGIGKAIGMRLAAEGANIVVAAKTTVPHPKLPGTIYSSAAEMEAAGGKALPIKLDIRKEEDVESGILKAVETFGGIDILINNASAIQLSGIEHTSMKRYDLMHQVNVRGSYLAIQKALPYLKKAENPHILNLSPPLNMDPRWFENHVAYTMTKYGMSMLVLGLSKELSYDGIAVNALWPKTIIATAAVKNLLGGAPMIKQSRKPSIVADAAFEILKKDSKKFTGHFCIDEDILSEAGVESFEQYAEHPGNPLLTDLFLDPEAE